MLLTNDELQLVREAVEVQGGINRDLIQRCARLIHINAFDEAVQQAFVILEERLRRLLKKERATGIQMVQFAFSSEGPFSKLLAGNQPEREGLEHLMSAAFKLYRNPAAHSIVGYSAAEARAIISLVDLILKQIDRLSLLPQPDALPANIEQTLQLVEQEIGGKATDQIRVLLKKCTNEGLAISTSAKKWIPFRRQALILRNGWEKPKPHSLTVFYLYSNESDQGLWFPVNQYYKNVVGLNLDEIVKRLRGMGFQFFGTAQDFYLSLNTVRDKPFYDKLFETIRQTVKEIDTTLS